MINFTINLSVVSLQRIRRHAGTHIHTHTYVHTPYFIPGNPTDTFEEQIKNQIDA